MGILSFLKSSGDGIGTAAGVAWPTFGLVTGALGLSGNLLIGLSAALITLTIGCVSVFFLLCLAISYWSYKDNKYENEQLDLALKKVEVELANEVVEYLLLQIKKYFFEINKKRVEEAKRNFFYNLRKSSLDRDTKVKKIKEAKKNLFYPILKKKIEDADVSHIVEFILEADKHIPVPASFIFLSQIKNNSKLLTAFVTQTKYLLDGKLLTVNTHFKFTSYCPKANEIAKQSLQKLIPPISIENQISSAQSANFKSGIRGFAGGFGSLAGCSAGLLGLLVTTGVLSGGLVTIPMVVVGIFIASLLFGSVTAKLAVSINHKKALKTQLIEKFSNIKTILINKINEQKSKVKADIKVWRGTCKFERKHASLDFLQKKGLRISWSSPNIGKLKTNQEKYKSKQNNKRTKVLKTDCSDLDCEISPANNIHSEPEKNASRLQDFPEYNELTPRSQFFKNSEQIKKYSPLNNIDSKQSRRDGVAKIVLENLNNFKLA